MWECTYKIYKPTHTDMDIKKIRKYADKSYGIDSSKLSDADVVKIVNKYLIGLSVCGNPRIAKMDAEEMGLKIDL